MATLVLSDIWVTLVSTAESVSAKSAGRSESNSTPGEVRYYVNGRSRAFSGVGEKSTFTFTLRAVTPADLATLKEWKGELVIVRDHKGRKIYGVYYDLGIEEFKTSLVYDVAMTVTEVSFTEGV